MSLTRQKILNVQITSSPKQKILEYIKKYLEAGGTAEVQRSKKIKIPLVILTPNSEQVVLALRYPYFVRLLNQADVTLPDGIGIVWAARLLGKESAGADAGVIGSRIAGVDFMDALVALAEEQRVRIGLIGGLHGLAVDALECLHQNHPKLSGWAEDGPEIFTDNSGIVEGPGALYWRQMAQKITTTKTQIIFVGLGAPKQELVIDRLVAACKAEGITTPVVMMAVGGSFDMLVGRLTRAPLFIRSIGFEWFWRLLQEPWRVKRQLSLVTFVRFVLLAKLRNKAV